MVSYGHSEVKVMYIYHSGITPKIVSAYHAIRPEVKISALMSFGRNVTQNSELLDDLRDKVDRIMLDSGTYTLNFGDKKYKNIITLEKYIEFLKSHSELFDYYFNFDEDFSQEGFAKNIDNQKKLEDKGFKPIPVVHDCDSYRESKYYIDYKYDYVAIGSKNLRSMSPFNLRQYMELYTQKNISVHLLGCTGYIKLSFTPTLSSDSSTWSQIGQREGLMFWNENLYKRKKIEIVNFCAEQYGHTYYLEYNNYIDLKTWLRDELGFTFKDMTGPNKRLNLCIANVHFFHKLTEKIKQNHRKQCFFCAIEDGNSYRV